ncbi:MAG: protein kinase [Acidobacteria bacterium]|nr:protein kinase [Acidobacteriota bacterium]
MKQCIKCKNNFSENNVPCPFDGGKHIPDNLLGTVIDGKYRLEKCIGRGGMGAVYLAQHTSVNKKFAVKVLLQSLVEANPAAYDRFRREAQATSRINHPNAISVIDFGQTEDGTSYLVMEYVEGVSLRRFVDRLGGKLPLDKFLNLSKQICSGILAAHKAGVVHRDIKPDNIMIETIDGQDFARVLDFGIAKLRDNQQHTNLTETGALLGTPTYMSPEQCSGEKVDHRTDIYSLGIMFYQMLSGEVPFKASSPPALIILHVTQAPKPLIGVYPNTPEPLSRVIMQTLEKRPDKRQRNVNELIEQLDAALNPTANQWKVVFNGLLDTSDATRLRLLQGLQQDFNIAASQAEQLISAKGVSVKKTRTQDEANKIAEKLRNLGANIKVETIVGEPIDQAKSQNTPAVNTLSFSSDQTIIDPLLETDSYKMLSYVSEKAKPSTNTGQLLEEATVKAKPNTGHLSEDSTMALYETDKTQAYSAQNSQSSTTSPVQTPVAIANSTGTSINSASASNTSIIPKNATSLDLSANLWKVEVDGQIYEDLNEETIDAWLWEKRLTHTDKICRGNGQWYEITTIPRFRRILTEIEIQESQTKKSTSSKTVSSRNEDKAFFSKAAKVAGVILGFYIIINVINQYYVRACVSSDLYSVLVTNRINVNMLRNGVQERLKDRSLYIPDKSIDINADYKNQRVSVFINFKQSLFLIPIKHQVKREDVNFRITMEHVIQIKEDDAIALQGVTKEEIEDYKQKKAEEEAKKAQEGAYVADRPLNERDALILELGKRESGILPSSGLIKQAIRAKQGEDKQ